MWRKAGVYPERVALVAGLVLLVLAIGVTLSGSPMVVVHTNSITDGPSIAEAATDAGACQGGEVLPGGVSMIRLTLRSITGPRVSLTALSGTHVLTSGVVGSGWIGGSVAIPVKPVARTTSPVQICFRLGPTKEVVGIMGAPTSPAVAARSREGKALPGRIRIEYLRADERSWWSVALVVARRIGLGRAASGSWIVLLLIALMAMVVAGASWLALKELGSSVGSGDTERTAREPSKRALGKGRAGVTQSLVALPRHAWSRIPTAARVCVLVAFLNAACWSLIMPAFQMPDEPDHFAYVQQLAETRSLPTSSYEEYSQEESYALYDLHNSEVVFRPEDHPISSRAQQQHLQRDLARPLSRSGAGGAGAATAQPPLYYALETIPYELGSSGSILDRLELMRLLSALLGGLTTLFAFLFLREALPTVRWAWTVGGLGVALAPLMGFASSAVNPDALLFTVSAALFYCLARAFRRGLTQRLAIAIGALIAAGFVTKLTFIGLAPGVILGLILLARREARTSGPGTYFRSLAPALLIAVSPGVLYAIVNALSNHPTLGIVSGNIAGLTNGHRSISAELSYIWQFYLPRLPGMHNDFGEIFTIRQIWFRNLFGLYGWTDTVFPGWVYGVALILVGLIVALCIRGLAVGRTALRQRRAELVTYAVISVGVLGLVGAAGYGAFPERVAEYAEPRYMLPMIALWGAVLALAARGAGRRWGPVVGVLIVVLVISHDIFSQLQVIARYYYG
jgi:4-amino-4-deoxy-L-arabinose transferase-like glycosyltransferase